MSRERIRVHGEVLSGGMSSRTSREAARRSLERGVRSFFVRMRRSGITFAALFAALVVYMIGFGGVGFFTFLLAMFAIMMLSFMVLFLPVRERRRGYDDWKPAPHADGAPAQRLDLLTRQTEEWLLDRCRALPREAGPALDRIIDRLRDLAPSLATVPAHSPLGGEAQRLIGQHLPGLVSTYLGLPPGERGFHAATSERLAESLAIVADQMDDLCERVAEERRMGFETERRFIETRYRDGDDLSPGRPG